MLATLVIYVVLSGHMQTIRIPQADMATCQTAAPDIAQRLHAMHAECKTRKARKGDAT